MNGYKSDCASRNLAKIEPGRFCMLSLQHQEADVKEIALSAELSRLQKGAALLIQAVYVRLLRRNARRLPPPQSSALRQVDSRQIHFCENRYRLARLAARARQRRRCQCRLRRRRQWQALEPRWGKFR